jgi:hypothetical protein
MNHEHTIPITAVVGDSILLAQMEKVENICNTILVDVNLCVPKISNLCCGHRADFDRQLSRANILHMFKIKKKVNPGLAIRRTKSELIGQRSSDASACASMMTLKVSLVSEASLIAAIAWIWAGGGAWIV